MVSAELTRMIENWVGRGGAHRRPPLIGVAGCQGSGKSTLCRLAATHLGAAHFSLDDVYLARSDRILLARNVHPLFETRGAPGTHDLTLARSTLERLSNADTHTVTPIPAFDKLADDRLPESDWPRFTGRPSAILVDGWCVGATPIADPELEQPINELEAEDDPRGVWRRAWNAQLAGPYQAWFDNFDAILFLAAPSFDVVLDWRCEQEASLMGISTMDLPSNRRADLAHFVSFYERLTRHMLAGGIRAQAKAYLGPDRRVRAVDTAPAANGR
jgi:D-glycerate 3-kinase